MSETTARRIRMPLGADCLSCDWRDVRATREQARQHARENPGHHAVYTLEESSHYKSSDE